MFQFDVPNSYSRIQVMFSNSLRDGDMLVSVDPGGTGGQVLFIGTYKTYVDTTIRRITREVFSADLLHQIGMWEPTSEEIKQKLEEMRKP